MSFKIIEGRFNIDFKLIEREFIELDVEFTVFGANSLEFGRGLYLSVQYILIYCILQKIFS